MTLESAMRFFIAIFLFSVTPGPGVFAIIARSMAKGARSSVAFCIGMALSAMTVSASQARRLMTSPSSMKVFNKTAGGIMASAGAYLVAKG